MESNDHCKCCEVRGTIIKARQLQTIVDFLDTFKVNPDDFDTVFDIVEYHFPDAVKIWESKKETE